MGQDIFEKKIDQAYRNCTGVARIVDDVQVFGNKEINIWQNLHEEIEYTRKEGIKHYFDTFFIKTKCCSL